ncbi:MAG: head decoration protein [Selenomonadaceae bacterium]|nr:head decoration protein [Selenomonadaceae bacterium]
MELVTDIKNTASYDELLAGPEISTLTKNIKLKSGAIYKRGMLISTSIGEDGITETGEQTTSGKTAEYVLMRNVDATEADTVGTVYVKGRFNRENIVLADGDTVEAHEAELRLRDIHFTTLKS